MPAISLVVCVHHESDLLERLICEGWDCYDDLAVVHDGPDAANVQTLVENAGGFFLRGRMNFNRNHTGPLRGQAKHDWILPVDPKPFMQKWIYGWQNKCRGCFFACKNS